jgi:hypothetical protein
MQIDRWINWESERRENESESSCQEENIPIFVSISTIGGFSRMTWG